MRCAPDAVARVLATAVPEPVTVDRLEPLTGGASADIWSVDATDGAGTAHALILRRGASRGDISFGIDPRLEPLVQRAAAGAAVPTADVLATFADDDALGTGYLMRRLPGETIPRKLFRDPAYAVALAALTGDCATALARVHEVPLDALPALPQLPAYEQLTFLESLHRSIGQPVPTFELGFAWLRERIPPPAPLRLVHGDFRTGNFLVDERGLVAVLDWELAHLGDPAEDIGWLCTRAWRFGGAGEVGGFGSRADFYAAYQRASGLPVDHDRVRFWEVFGSLKWGIICQLQAFAHLRGERPSVERAAIGRRVTEAELDLLLLTL
ncbi:MAG TPA: phosphotransferase family protein [Actinophytocola sp.]|uniref:phosphotransferase family protein n=1 Tax=Actinophytocola sp. TaxID=1872138 RepID=UPI002DBFFA12|nr:phosphotransferase family protein [Actinophytocola sp.]HEU5472421.1 phosphotransferase family protein [Actinophytocola sp.]